MKRASASGDMRPAPQVCALVGFTGPSIPDRARGGSPGPVRSPPASSARFVGTPARNVEARPATQLCNHGIFSPEEQAELARRHEDDLRSKAGVAVQMNRDGPDVDPAILRDSLHLVGGNG